MTVVGTAVHQRQAVRVDSIGSLPGEGWSSVARIKGADLPGGTGQWAFACWGSLGHIEVLRSNGVGNATVEVGLGTQNGPFQDYVHRLLFTNGDLRGNLRAHPFFHVIVFHSSLAGGRGTWSSSNDLVLWARIALNGDPPGTVAGSFLVANVSLLAFRASAFAGTEFWADTFQPAAIQFNNPQASGFRNFHVSGTAGIFTTTGKEWLVFAMTRYAPGGTAGAPLFQTCVTPDGSTANFAPLLGVEGKHGSLPRGPGSNPSRTTYHHGGFRTFTVANTATQIGLRGYDYGNPSGQTAGVIRWEAFAVRTDKLGFFGKVQKDQPAVALIFNDWTNPTPVFEPSEYARPFFADLHVLLQAAWDNDEIPTQTMSHCPIVGSNLGSLPQGRGDALFHLTAHPTEGIPGPFGLVIPSLRPDLVQLKGLYLQNPLEGNSQGAFRKPADFILCSWSWENDPNYVPFPATLPGPDVVVVPGREAPATAGLPTLPSQPETSYEEGLEAVLHELRPLSGEVLTWPKFLGARRAFTLRWSAQSRSQRDAILTFFATLSNRAFQWTPPGEPAAIPLAMVEAPSSTDVGVLHVVTVRALELVFVGP